LLTSAGVTIVPVVPWEPPPRPTANFYHTTLFWRHKPQVSCRPITRNVFFKR